MNLPLPVLITLFSLIGGVLSLIGGFFLLWKSPATQRFSIHMITFAAGTLLAVSFLDILPEAIERGGDAPTTLRWTLFGLVAFFIIERILLRLHVHDEADHVIGQHTHHSARRLAPWLVTLGDGIHNFIDGVAITAGFLVSVPTGIVTAIAVAAHEVPQEISDFSIMLHGGMSRRKVATLNVIAALMTTVGALLAYAFREQIEDYLGVLLAVAAGIFIYVASSDLIPEIHANIRRDAPSHVMIILITSILITWGLTEYTHQYLEASHGHEEEVLQLHDEEPGHEDEEHEDE